MIYKIITLSLLIGSILSISHGYIDTGLLLLVMMSTALVNEKLDKILEKDN